MTALETVSLSQQAITDLAARRVVIAELKEKHAGTAQLDLAVKANYELCRQGIGELRKLRTGIDKRRKELVADAVQWQREVNGMAKGLVEDIELIEGPMQTAKDKLDNAVEEERKRKAEEVRLAQEAAARLKVEEEAAAAKSIRDAEDARLKEDARKLAEERAAFEKERQAALAIQKDERDRIEAAQAAERAKLDEQRRAHEAEQKAARDKIDAERLALEAEKAAQERARFEQEAKAKAEKEAAERVERQRILAEQAAAAKAEADRKEAERIESVRPDVEKVHGIAKQIAEIKWPAVKSREAIAAMGRARKSIDNATDRLLAFRPETKEDAA